MSFLKTLVSSTNPLMSSSSLLIIGIVAVVAFGAGGGLGYKFGSAVTYKQEDAKVDQCRDTLTKAEIETLAKAQTGQATLIETGTETKEKATDSEAKREALLGADKANPKPPVARVVTRARTVVAAATPSPTPGSQPEALPVDEGPQVEYVVPQSTISVINQLLEISNETQFYSLTTPVPVVGGVLVGS